MRLGDAIATVATPLARMVGADCIDPETNDLRPESPCAKAKNQLNHGVPLWNVIWDRFFEKRTKGEKVKFILQIEVEADDVEKALSKKNEGTVLSINPRPTPPAPQARVPAPMMGMPARLADPKLLG